MHRQTSVNCQVPQDQGAFAISYRSRRPPRGTRTVRSSSRSACLQAPAWSRTWRTQVFRLTALWASASCTWHRVGSSSIASARCRRTSRPARSRSATSPGAPASTGAAFALRISEAGDTVKLSSSGGQTWIGHASADLDLSSGHGGLDIDRADATHPKPATVPSDRPAPPGELSTLKHPVITALPCADSKRGPVRNSVPPREDPGPSDHKVTVHARTRYGDIVIQPAAN